MSLSRKAFKKLREAGYVLGLATVLATKADARVAPTTITVVAGTYGSTCKQPHGNKTQFLAASCNGKLFCSFAVDPGRIGDPAYGCRKDFVAEWSCGGTAHKANAAPEAAGGTIPLSCENAASLAAAIRASGKADVYGVLFDTDKTAVKPERAPTLDEVAKLLKADPSLKLEVSGHTDSTGDKAHNIKLSEDRAIAVVQALVKTYGVDATRLSAKGYGDTEPVAPNATDECRAKNRRVELRKM